ncbi:hypothetical protein AGMMS49938_19020 [Fibrobacterales bacterium]|nr:hypothetical protein AGMMS49938_19020 [Fibrobacterales bacterium]
MPFPEFNDVKGYLSDTEIIQYENLLEKIFLLHKEGAITQIAELIKMYVEHFANIVIISEWSEYGKIVLNSINNNPTSGGGGQDSPLGELNLYAKYSNALEMLRMIKPLTIVDIAGNSGIIDIYLKDEVKYSVVIDSDSNALNDLWEYTKENRITIVPVYMNILTPNVGRGSDGFVDSDGIKAFKARAIDRFKCECAVALGIIHHLCYKSALQFEAAIRLFSWYTNKYLLIEFVDRQDPAVCCWNQQGMDFYTKSNFEQKLNKVCKIIQTASAANIYRTLYLCELKH